MNWLIEFVVVALFGIPGGFIRWVIFRKKPLKRYMTDDPYLNVFPLVVLGILFLILKNY